MGVTGLSPAPPKRFRGVRVLGLRCAVVQADRAGSSAPTSVCRAREVLEGGKTWWGGNRRGVVAMTGGGGATMAQCEGRTDEAARR